MLAIVIIVEVVLLGLVLKHLWNIRRYEREMYELHIMLMKINDEIVQIIRSLK